MTTNNEHGPAKNSDHRTSHEEHVKGSPLTREEFDAISQERTEAFLEAMQNPIDPREQAALQLKHRKMREYEWDLRVLEFEDAQRVYGTRMALSNFVFEILCEVSIVYMPGCYGLVANDGSKVMDSLISAAMDVRETEAEAKISGINPNPTPRARKN